MALVKFSKKEFEKHVKLGKETEEKIAMLGTPFEGIENEEVAIEIFPNRPDLLSLQGYIRAFMAFLGKKTGLKKYEVNKPEKNYEVFIDNSVKDIRPFTACAIVKNLKLDDEKIKEIIDIQEKIHNTLGRNRKKIALGIYPLDKIALPIKFEARKPEDIKFMPLESEKEMTGAQILKEHPTGQVYSHLLEGMKKYPVFVDANNEILSMPPIINSHKTGKITEATKEVFIECSGFDLEILKKTLNILVTIFADMQGQVYQMKLMYGNKPEITPNLESDKIKINHDNINKLLGLNLKEKEIKECLEKMGYDYKEKEHEVLIPAWRVDILHEVDIAEDIAIAYGYENFKPEIPEISTVGEEDKKQIFLRKVSEILVGLNISEISNYHLLMQEDLKKSNSKQETVEIEKSKTEYTLLRPNLFCSMLKTLSQNIDSEYPQKLFEIGKIFLKDDKQETGVKENNNLIVACVPSNFNELKEILEYLARMLEIKFEIHEEKEQGFIEGRTGKIMFGEKHIGTLGEIHPNILRNWHIKMPLALFEIDLEEIFDILSNQPK